MRYRTSLYAAALCSTIQQLDHLQKSAGFFDGLGQAASGGWNALKGLGNQGLAAISRPFQQVGSAYNSAMGAIDTGRSQYGGIQGANKVNDGQWNAGGQQANTGMGNMIAGGIGAMNGAMSGLRNMGQSISQGAHAAGQAAHQVADSAWNTGRDVAQGAGQMAGQAAQAVAPFAQAGADVLMAPARLGQAAGGAVADAAGAFGRGWSGQPVGGGQPGGGQPASQAPAPSAQPMGGAPGGVGSPWGNGSVPPANPWGGVPQAGIPRAGVVGTGGTVWGGFQPQAAPRANQPGDLTPWGNGSVPPAPAWGSPR